MPRNTVAADTSDALGVVAAGFKPLHHAGDPFQAEHSVVLGVEGVVGEGEILEVIVEDMGEGSRPARDIAAGRRGGDRGGGRGHISENSLKVISAWRHSSPSIRQTGGFASANRKDRGGAVARPGGRSSYTKRGGNIPDRMRGLSTECHGTARSTVQDTVAADTGDTLGVVVTAFEFVAHMGNTFQVELAEVLGVEAVAGIGESVEMVVEYTSQDIRPQQDIGGGACGRDRERR